VTIALTVVAFVAALFLSQYVPRQFFPASDRPELTVDMTLRQNASIYATEAQAKRFEALLSADPMLTTSALTLAAARSGSSSRSTSSSPIRSSRSS